MKHITLGFLILLAFGPLLAQKKCNAVVRGQILNVHDSLPVPFAEVFVETGHLHAQSNTEGHFTLTGICAGRHLIEVDKQGFQHRHQELLLYGDTNIIIYMVAINGWTDTITIHARKEKSAAMALSGQNIMEQNDRDLSQISASLPGIQLLQGGRNQSKPVAHGMFGLRFPIISQQFRLEGQSWGNDHNPEADARGFDEVEWVKDASLLKFGHDGIGGALRLHRNPSAHDGEQNLDQVMSYNSNGHQAGYAARFIQKADSTSPVLYANAALRKSGNYRTPDVWLENTALSEISLSGGYAKMHNERETRLDGEFYRFESGIFRGTRTGNVEDLLTAISRSVPVTDNQFSYSIDQPRQVAAHATVQASSITYTSHGRKEWHYALQYDQRREFDFHRNSTNRFPQLDLILLSPSVIFRQLRKTNATTQWEWGNQSTGYLHRFGGFYFLPDFQGWSNGTYGMLHKHSEKVAHTFSLRLDEKQISARERVNGTWQQQSRFFINYSAAYTGVLQSGKHLFQWHVSRMWRAPWVNELYSSGVHHGAASFEQGNRNLKTEKSYRAELEWEYNHNKQITAYLSPFFNYMPGFINLTPMTEPVLTVRGAFPGFEYLQGNAIFTGGDAQIKLTLAKNLEIQTGMQYVYARYTQSARYPAFVPPFRSQNTLTWKRWKMLFQLQHEFAARQHLYIAGSDFLPPPPAYHLWHIKLKSLQEKQNDWQWNLEVNNLLNQHYRSYMDRFRYFMDMPGRNIRLVIIKPLHHHHKKHL
ncbi:MAG: TonB-dependent receptor plug domain-containing protein [Sphingomonadales bacterium]|jgi:iron complex outermembrane receptor protein